MKRIKKEYRKAEDVLDQLSPMQIATLYDFYNEDPDKSMVYLEMAAEGGLLWLHLSAKQGLWLAMKELSDRLRLSDPKASARWLKRYYRNKDKHDAWRWHGKKYMREFKRERQPEIINGEVVILI